MGECYLWYGLKRITIHICVIICVARCLMKIGIWFSHLLQRHTLNLNQSLVLFPNIFLKQRLILLYCYFNKNLVLNQIDLNSTYMILAKPISRLPYICRKVKIITFVFWTKRLAILCSWNSLKLHFCITKLQF